MSLKSALEDYRSCPGPVLITPGLRHYDWGDPVFICELLGIANEQRKPHAELWMGAHPSLPSGVSIAGASTDMEELIRHAGEAVLGPGVIREFGGLPFLLKILAASRPLSIQVHPTKARARDGFARENAAGVPLDAGHRNYKDGNHKPELIVAIRDLYALRGFRPAGEIAEFLAGQTELSRALPEFRSTSASLRAVYEAFLRLPRERVDALLSPLVEELARRNASRPFSREEHGYWALRADAEYSRRGHRAPGLFSIFLLNLVHLRPLQALYLPAGVLHAYLEGVGVEVMASSDNVLRGGLTSKHVDVEELLATVDFECGPPEILEAEPVAGDGQAASGSRRFRTPAEEFELRLFDAAPGRPWRQGPDHGGEILLVLSEHAAAEASMTAPGAPEPFGSGCRVGRGAAVFVPRNVPLAVEASAPVTVFQALIPDAANAPLAGNKSSAGVSQGETFRGRACVKLRFGTSGLRGKVEDITDLEAAINTRGFLEYLLSEEGLRRGDAVCVAGDLRPSTDSEQRSILRAVAHAIGEAGLEVENLGRIPTPALTFHAMKEGRPSVMVTGSHIPFDRNGIKFNKRSGEVLKEDEPGILEAVERVRRQEYARPAASSPYADNGMFRAGVARPLPRIQPLARDRYIQRYTRFFAPGALRGLRLVLYEHSAVGRELLAEILRALGAEVVALGRSTEFVAIDTEAVTPERLGVLQDLADAGCKDLGSVDAVVSTDGDSDRPLLAGVDARGRTRFFGGDLLGVVVADFLDADFIAVPVSANDAVDLHFARKGIQPVKTRIGSPHVIAALRDGKGSRKVGWEANGGFLTGSDIERDGRVLGALPTRDAVLPLLAALAESAGSGRPLVDIFAALPRRFGRAGLIDNFDSARGRAIVERFTPPGALVEVSFRREGEQPAEALAVKEELEEYFSAEKGFAPIERINTLDGVRIVFANNEIAHIRPSGNAPQMRVYAVADRPERAEGIVQEAIRTPDGILHRMALLPEKRSCS